MDYARWGRLMIATFFVVCSVVAFCWVMIRALYPSSGAVGVTERDSNPEALQDAKLVYLEKLFRISTPIGLSARLDRAYQMPSGEIVLMEFKSRQINRAFASDVIQLSVQKMALQGRTGQIVAPYGYVTVKVSGNPAQQTSHRVELMSDTEVIALVKRRNDLLAHRVDPRYSKSQAMCRQCAFQSRCDRPALGRGNQS